MSRLTQPATYAQTMPPTAWQRRPDASRPGWGRQLTAADLAADPQRVLMTATVYDGIAAAAVDAFEYDMERQDERQDGIAIRDTYNVLADYQEAPQERDVSTGPGAWTSADPDIIVHSPSQDLRRRDASGPYRAVESSPLGARPGTLAPGSRIRLSLGSSAAVAPQCPRCRTRASVQVNVRTGARALRCACAARPAETTASYPTTSRARPDYSDTYYAAPTSTSSEYTSDYTPEKTSADDDAATSFMTSAAAPGRGPSVTSGAARAAQRAMRASGTLGRRPVRTTTTYNSAAASMGDAVYGLAVPSGRGNGVAPYDAPGVPLARLGVTDRFGLHHMPGTIDTTSVLLDRTAAAAGYPGAATRSLRASERSPRTDALGFRFSDPGQFKFGEPKFYPAADPVGIEQMLYAVASETAPDMAADLEDARAFRDVYLPEPLEARYAHMKEIALGMSKVDPYMVPRTGPSVTTAGMNAAPPAWFKPAYAY